MASFRAKCCGSICFILATLLLIFSSEIGFLSEFISSNFRCDCTHVFQPQFVRNSSQNGSGRRNEQWEMSTVPNISLHEAFFVRAKMVDVEEITERSGRNLRSRFLPNTNFRNFPLLAVEDVCMDPKGTLLLVNISHDEVNANLSSIPELVYLWKDLYAHCGNTSLSYCTGVRHIEAVPESHSWIKGNTLHFIAYESNVMHNFGERVWPYISSFALPFNLTTPKPVHHFLMHDFQRWLADSQHRAIAKTVLWQLRMLMELAKGADYLNVERQKKTICFERFLLQVHDRVRIDGNPLPKEIYQPAMQNFRKQIFNFFGLPLPQVVLPPHPLRVLFYGRKGASRRIVNKQPVLEFLRNFSRPRLQVYELDELLANGNTSYDLPDVIRMYSNADILITAHGSNTWATILMPEGAGLIEVFGPCNFGWFNWTDLTNLRSWNHPMVAGANLKFDLLANPFGKVVPNPRIGNTTECQRHGVPDFELDKKKLETAIASFAYPARPADRLTLHWLYDYGKP